MATTVSVKGTKGLAGCFITARASVKCRCPASAPVVRHPEVSDRIASIHFYS